MGETNFYSYMFAQSGTVAFDELAEVVDLSNPESIQRAFESYLSDYNPPSDIKDDVWSVCGKKLVHPIRIISSPWTSPCEV